MVEGTKGPALGVERRIVRCWEYGTVVLGPSAEENIHGVQMLGEINVVSAWFGDPEDPSQRSDIAAEVQRMEAAARAQGHALEVLATTRLWGDPARFCMKQLEVSYELMWLLSEERAALEALQRRVCEKAQLAPDLDVLLERLGAALCPSSSSPAQALTACDAVEEIVPSSLPLGQTSPRWRQLGFQSNDPRSDLRTGRLALESLVYLAERFPLATGQMVREAQSDGIDYPFAVASINVTQLLARYLGLTSDAISGVAGSGHVAPKHVVRCFARLLLHADISRKVDPFCEFHAAVMSRLHMAWRARKAEDPHLTVMEFPPALEETLGAVHSFCLTAALESAAEFRELAGGREVGDTSANAELESGALHASVQQTVKTVSNAAGVLGTYLQGVLGEGWRSEAMPASEFFRYAPEEGF